MCGSADPEKNISTAQKIPTYQHRPWGKVDFADFAGIGLEEPHE
jgi:hypothetical protein